jgi:cell division transport system permease protein
MTNRVDQLGLRGGREFLLPMLVGAMSFLAALAIAGTLATGAMAAHWRNDTGTALTIQVPPPRLAAVLAALAADPDVDGAHLLSGAEMNALLKPWLGADAGALALPVPAVITASWAGAAPPDALAARLAAIAPGTLVETGARWAARVAALTASLQACAAAVLLIVAAVAAGVVAVATRAGLAQRRAAIEIVHGLGALDTDIADSFAERALLLAVAGALAGTLLALPVLFWLAGLAAPFASVPDAAPALPVALWVCLPVLPLVAAVIGWATAQFTVRHWLRGLA